MKEATELGHLLVFAFLFCLGAFMAAPVITDVTMAALCPGRDQCSLAIYLTGLQQAADKVPEERRAAAFGVFSGVCTAGFVVGTIAARFLSVSSTFQVAALAAVAAAVYMRAFVQEMDSRASLLLRDEEASCLLCVPSSSAKEASPRLLPLRKAPSLSEMATLITSR